MGSGRGVGIQYRNGMRHVVEVVNTEAVVISLVRNQTSVAGVFTQAPRDLWTAGWINR